MAVIRVCTWSPFVDCVWNVMAHAQKPDFIFRRKGQVHLSRLGASVQSTTGSRGVGVSGSNAGYTMFRGSVKSTGYPLHSPVSPSLPIPCVTVCHHISTGLYFVWPDLLVPGRWIFLRDTGGVRRITYSLHYLFVSFHLRCRVYPYPDKQTKIIF